MIRGRQKQAGKKRARAPLPAHRLFAPLLGLWGAALGGLVTLVLPREAVLGAAAQVGLGALDAAAPFALAGLAALMLGTGLFLVARALARTARKAQRPDARPSLAAMAMRHVRTIDPASELGSGSLDEPVETMPFAALRPDAMAAEESAPEPAQDDLPPNVALDLAEFAALPGRNAVWVEAADTADADEAAAAPEPAPASADPAAVPPMQPPLGSSAIERLRAVPPSELSLIQMVERFAAALHEHQAAAARDGQRADLAGRDAALAEALKTLAALSKDGATATQSAPLREALTRLHELRGAA
ncbi:MAG: hypothetical protein V2I74_01610 [Erythrobacter sp.]|jgi:hypothetical protein|nr:hypothetical protein [Erythrobacter sp.]